jgi:DNA-binding XRE family transcriptional regulator
MTAQIVEISGQKIAMLPAEEYESLLERLEDQSDIAAAIRAEKRALAGEEYVPFELVESIINGENALKVWRKYRGLTLNELAEKTGARHATLSLIENGKAQGKPALWRALATALHVDVDDILPDS